LRNEKLLSFPGFFMSSVPNSSVHSSDPSPGPVRESWLLEVTAVAQRILTAGTLSRFDAVRAVIAAVPRPRTRVEELVLAGMVIEMTLGEPRGTRSDLNRYVEKLGALMPAGPWSAVARRVALSVRQRCHAPLSAPQLARDLGVNESTLREEFKREFGLTPGEYHRRVRVAAALDLLTPDGPKVSAIASALGYRGERNLYAAVRDLTGYTPGQLRRLSPAARRSMAAALTAMSQRPTPIAGSGTRRPRRLNTVDRHKEVS
jgi:AraC-like DNA-binding protein